MTATRSLSPKQTLTILTGLNLLNYIDRYVLSAVLSPIKGELNLSDGELGRIATAFMLGYLLTSPFFGYLGDRSSRKWLVAAGIFVWSLATVFTGFATSMAMLILCRIFVGLGEASYATISPGIISDTFPPSKRNNALTIFYVAIPVGSALGFILGGNVAAHASWRHAFYWAGAPGLILAAALLPFMEPRRGASEGKADDPIYQKKPTMRDVARLFKLRKYNLLLIAYTAYTFALGAFAYWGPTFLARVHQVSMEKASTFFGGVLVITGLLGTLIGGMASSALQKRRPSGYAWTLGLSALVASPFTYVGFATDNAGLAMASLAIAMFLLFLGTGPVNTLTIELVPVNLRSSAMALSIFAIHAFGDMWSPEIVGRVADVTGNLRDGVLILPFAIVVGAIVYIWLATIQDREAKAASIK